MDSSVAAIVLGVIFGIMAVMVIIVVILLCKRRRARQKQSTEDSTLKEVQVRLRYFFFLF